MRDLYVPNEGQIDEAGVWRWYQNILLELQSPFLSAAEREYLYRYYRNAGLLRWWRAPFFRRHFSHTFAKSVSFLLRGQGPVRLLDLGCGAGTQSLLFAMLGADVFAIDRDEQALEILEKRRRLYQESSGRELRLTVLGTGAFEADFRALAPLHGVHSMFAFNLMQPSEVLLQRLLPAMSPRARLAVHDGNNRSWPARLIPARRRDVWSPDDFETALSSAGFKTCEHEGGVSLPPLVWRLPGFAMWSMMDSGLNRRSWLFPVSHQVLAERG